MAIRLLSSENITGNISVSGTATFTGNITGVGASFIGTAASGAPLVTIENNSGSTATSYGLLVIGGGNSSNGKTFEVRDASGNSDLIVKGTGNVGIATATPQKKFHIEGTGGASEMQILVSSASDTVGHTAGIGLRGEGGEADGDFRIKGGIFFERIAGSFGNGKMILAVNSSVSNTSVTVADHALTIDTNKNVGIGTDSPTSYYSGADNLVIKQDSGEGGMSIVTANDTSGAIYFADGTSGNEQYRGGIGYTHSTDKLFLVSGGQTRVWMDDSGNVGIGTDDPYAFDTTATKLHVKNEGSSGSVSEVARFQGSADADGSGGTIRLGTSNDRGIYFEGGRTGSVPYGKIGTTEYNGAKTVAITLDGSGNSTFAGDVGIGGVLPLSNGGSGATVLGVHDGVGSGWAVTKYTNTSTGTAAADGTLFGIINLDAYIFNYESANIILATSSTTALTIDASQNATFAGKIESVKELINVNSANGTRSGGFEVQDDGDLFIGTATTAGNIVLETGNSTNGLPSTGTARLTVNSTGATFAGEISSGNDINVGGKIVCANVGSDKKIAFRRTGANNFSIEHDSSSLYFYNESTTELPIRFFNNGDVSMTGGNVGIGVTNPSSELEVDGRAIVAKLEVARYSDANAPAAVYVGRLANPMGAGGVFRLGTIESSSTVNKIDEPFLITYSSGHWGCQPMFFAEFTVTYYRGSYIKYWAQHEVSGSRLEIVDGPYGGQIITGGAPVSRTITTLCNNCHGGQPVYKCVWKWSNSGTYIKTSPIVSLVEGHGSARVYTSGSSSESAIDTLLGSAGSPGPAYLLMGINNAQAAGFTGLQTQN